MGAETGAIWRVAQGGGLPHELGGFLHRRQRDRLLDAIAAMVPHGVATALRPRVADHQGVQLGFGVVRAAAAASSTAWDTPLETWGVRFVDTIIHRSASAIGRHASAGGSGKRRLSGGTGYDSGFESMGTRRRIAVPGAKIAHGGGDRTLRSPVSLGGATQAPWQLLFTKPSSKVSHDSYRLIPSTSLSVAHTWQRVRWSMQVAKASPLKL